MSCGRFGFLCLPDVRCSVFRVYLRVIRNASGFRIAPNKSEENRRTMKTQRNLETPDHYEHSESPITLGGKLSDNPPKPRGGSACATVPGGVGSPDPAAQQHFLRLVGLLRLVTVEVPGAPPPPSIPAGRCHGTTETRKWPGDGGTSWQEGQDCEGPERSLWRDHTGDDGHAGEDSEGRGSERSRAGHLGGRIFPEAWKQRPRRILWREGGDGGGTDGEVREGGARYGEGCGNAAEGGGKRRHS